jgi:hypothetical protein
MQNETVHYQKIELNFGLLPITLNETVHRHYTCKVRHCVFAE